MHFTGLIDDAFGRWTCLPRRVLGVDVGLGRPSGRVIVFGYTPCTYI